MSGDSKVGEGIVPVQLVVNQPGEWVDMKCDLKNPKSKESAGKFIVRGRFLEQGALEEGEADPFADAPGAGDHLVDDMKSIEEGLRSQIQKVKRNAQRTMGTTRHYNMYPQSLIEGS